MAWFCLLFGPYCGLIVAQFRFATLVVKKGVVLFSVLSLIETASSPPLVLDRREEGRPGACFSCSLIGGRSN